MNNVDMCLLLINRIESSSNPHSSTSSSFKYVTFTAMWQKVLKQGKFSVSEAHFIHKSCHFTVDMNMARHIGPGLVLSQWLLFTPPSNLSRCLNRESVYLKGLFWRTYMLRSHPRVFYVWALWSRSVTRHLINRYDGTPWGVLLCQRG